MQNFPNQQIDEATVRKAAARRAKDEKEANAHSEAIKKAQAPARASREQLDAMRQAINLSPPEDSRDTSTRVVWSSEDFTQVVCDLRTFLDHMKPGIGSKFNKESMPFLRDAYYPWSHTGPVKHAHTSPTMIILYEKLVQDMIKNSETWSLFWKNCKNIVWCERSVGVINTYATILRQKAERMAAENSPKFRESLVHCEKTLNLGGRQLVLFKAMAYSGVDMFFGEQIQLINTQHTLKGLTYRYFLIKHNLLWQTNRYKKINISELKFVCEYELEFCSPNDDETKCMKVAHNILQVMRLSTTKQAFSSISNQQIKDSYFKYMKRNIPVDAQEFVQLCSKMCGSCGKFEEAEMEEPYKKCSACLTENYCSRECQKNDWKNHKITCNENKKL
jgi:hypothetical protein